MQTLVENTLVRPGAILIPGVLSAAECADLIRLPTVMHHDDEGGHVAQAKTLILPHVADALFAHIRGLDLDGFEAVAVDQMMKAYRLEAPEGAVPAHVDDDYEGPAGTRALHSIVVYLNAGYVGGETLFEGGAEVSEHGAGDVLLFRHDIRHEARAVTHGVKFVLKTDLFVRA